MTKKRRLSDLFVVGREIEFDDGGGEPLKVWLQKLNPVEHETAMRRAAGARARVLSGRHEAELEMARDEAAQFGRDGWIEFLASDILGKKLTSIESELAAEDEWAEQDYLQGLKDVWETSMEQVLKEEPDDPNALRVREELDRFRVEYEKRVEGERERIIKDLEAKDDDDLERRVVDRLIGTRGDLAWLTEFRKCEVWLATRDADDHHCKYFTSREEVDDLSQTVLMRLMGEYQDISVDPLEGKDSGAIPNSSASSESPAVEETEELSGQEAVPA